MDTMHGDVTQRRNAGSQLSAIDNSQRHSVLVALPPPNTKRWVPQRKAAVVAAVTSGAITIDEACRRYTLSVEEYLSWQEMIEKHGVKGLYVTKLQDFRIS